MIPQRVLIIGLNYAPEPVGIGPYTQGLAEALVERGVKVEVVAGQPYYPQWSRYPGFSANWRRTIENGVSIVRCPHYVPAVPGGLKRVLHLASFALAALPPAIAAAVRGPERQPQLVIAIAPALLGVITAWLAARLAGAKLWVHLQDFEIDAAVATGLLGKDGIPMQLARWMEGRILQAADHVSTISPQMCARLVEKGVEPERISEVRNWADARFVADSAGAAQFRAEWSLGDRKVALYSGNIARKQGIEILVEAARLLAIRDDIILVICGEGPNRAALEQQAEGLSNVQLHDLQPTERMGAMLTLADIHLLPQIAGAADLVLPSKLTNMLASGRPVIATTREGTGLFAEVDGCGMVTPPGDAAALAAAIAELADAPERRKLLGAKARQRARDRWSMPAIIDRMVADFAQL